MPLDVRRDGSGPATRAKPGGAGQAKPRPKIAAIVKQIGRPEKRIASSCEPRIDDGGGSKNCGSGLGVVRDRIGIADDQRAEMGASIAR